MNDRPYTVLTADGSTDDIALLAWTLRQSLPVRLLACLGDGDQIVEYFEGQGKYHDRRVHPVPDVLFLDLGMPKRSGFEALEYLRQKETTLPKKVVILTSHVEAADVKRAYDLGASFIDCKTSNFRPMLRRLLRTFAPDSSPTT